MAITLTAVQCPVPVVETGYPRLTDSENTTGTSAYNRVSRSFGAGDTASVPSKLNRNANALDQAFNFGGGAFAILKGLTLSIGSGLNCTVAAGLAAIGGPVEVTASTDVAVAANHGTATDRVWIWLTQAGALTSTLNTTPPATRCVCLGSCTTDATSVTAVDSSGVVYMKGGMPWRETADKGPPGDSPSSTLSFFAQTLSGVYLWDDGAYRAVYVPMATNKLNIASTEAVYIGTNEQVFLWNGLSPLVIDGTITIAGELILY